MATPRKPSTPKRKPAARKAAPRRKTTTASQKVVEAAAAPVSEEERQAKLTAYNTLRSAGVAVPEALGREVEVWIAEENARRAIEAEERTKRQAALDKENKKGPWFVRNGYVAPFSLRLERQTEKRRIELKPRGTPGDMHPLQAEDLDDPLLKQNVAIGVIEVIPVGEANRIIEHQTTNMSKRVHTPTSILRGPSGQPYAEGAVKVEAEFNSQGVTVATLDPQQMQGQVSDQEVKRSFGGMERVQPGQERQMVSEFVPTGGNPAIISQGGTIDRNTQAKVADDLARRKGLQGPGTGLGGLTVTVDPVQQS